MKKKKKIKLNFDNFENALYLTLGSMPWKAQEQLLIV